jgi:hypothetical protein
LPTLAQSEDGNMRGFVLYQQMILESGSKQFIDSLEVFLTAYIGVIAALFFILLLLVSLLAINEKREERAGRNDFAEKQKPQVSSSQDLCHSAYDKLFISQDSLI